MRLAIILILILILLSLLALSQSGAATLIQPYQINWSQSVDHNVTVNGTLSAINFDANATRLTAAEGNISILQTDLALNSSRIDAANATHLALLGGTMAGNISMIGYSILNQTIELSPPSGPQNGSIYYNLTDHKIYIYDNSTWLATAALS